MAYIYPSCPCRTGCSGSGKEKVRRLLDSERTLIPEADLPKLEPGQLLYKNHYCDMVFVSYSGRQSKGRALGFLNSGNNTWTQL
jgi:hypothetical protein